MSAITIAHSLQPEKPLQKFRHTIMIIISGHLIGGILYILFGVAHGNTNARTLQHFQIILIISESDHMHPVNTKLCAEHGKTHTLVHTCSKFMRTAALRTSRRSGWAAIRCWPTAATTISATTTSGA